MRATRLIVIALLLSISAFADDTFAKIDQVMKSYEAVGKLNGVVLIADHGKIVYEKGFGYANFEWQVPNTPDAKFRIGSVTKPFTALLVMQQVNAGKLKLEGHISEYLPEYRKDTGSKVTIRHLLAHTSGIPTYIGAQIEDVKETLDRRAFEKRFCQGDLQSEPGTQFGYNNCGYFILAEILERVTGKTYAELLRQNITEPLGLKNTGVDTNGLLLPKRAAGYDKNFVTGIAPARNTEMTWALGAGDMYSTVEDLFRFEQALYTEHLLPAALRDEMIKIDAAGRPASLGWFVSKAGKEHPAEGATIVAHEGNIFGYFTMLTRIPERKATVIIIDNTHLDEFPAITRDALAVLYGKEPSTPKPLVLDVVGPMILKDGVSAAIAKYNELKNSDAYEPGGLFTLGSNLMSAGRPNDALEIFRFAEQQNPKSWSAVYGQVLAHLALGQRDEAAAACKRLVEMNPKNPFATHATEKVKAAQGAGM